MAVKDPTMGAQKWAQNLAAAVPSIKSGVMAVTESPTAKAAQNLEKASRNYQQAVNSGRMAQRLNNVTLQQWQQAMTTTGIDRIQSGTRKGQPKYQQFAQSFYPVMAQASAAAKALPNNSTADALQRVATVINAAKQWAGKM